METGVAAGAAAGQPKKRTFKKFSFRGVDLDALLDMSTDELAKLFSARARRRSLFFFILIYIFLSLNLVVIYFDKEKIIMLCKAILLM